MRRWRERLERDGYSGLADRRKGKPSAKRIPLATVEMVLGLFKETYFDLNISGTFTRSCGTSTGSS
jgi:hypothetical protein